MTSYSICVPAISKKYPDRRLEVVVRLEGGGSGWASKSKFDFINLMDFAPLASRYSFIYFFFLK